MSSAHTFPHGDHEEELELISTSVVHAAARVWAACALPGLPAAAWWAITGEELWCWAALSTSAICAAVAGVSFLTSFARNRGVRIVVTTLAVTRRQRRLFSRREETIRLSAIETIDYDQNIVGLVFNFGAIVITAGGRTMAWRNVASPRKIVEEIKGHMEHEHGRSPLTER